MKREWMKTVLLLGLILIFCSCASTPKGGSSDKKDESGKEEKKDQKKKKDKDKDKKDKEDKKDSKDKEDKEVKKDKPEKEDKPDKKEKKEKDGTEDYYQRGLKKFKDGNFETAVEDFKKGVDKDPKDFQAYFGLGQAYEKLNQTKEAEDAYEYAIEIKPDYLPVREALGLVCFHQKKFQKAELHLKVARILKSKVPEVYFGLGEIEQMEKSCRTAIIAYKQALKLDPNYAAARNGLKTAERDCRQKQLRQQKQTPIPAQRQQLSAPQTLPQTPKTGSPR